MEVNTALIMYKSYVRSIMDYGICIYYPKHIRSCMKIERIQFKGVRTVLGYRNSSPTNVMMEEAKIPYLQDRASWLANNFWLKTYKRGNWDLINGMCKLNRLECRDRLLNPRNYVNIFSASF